MREADGFQESRECADVTHKPVHLNFFTQVEAVVGGKCPLDPWRPGLGLDQGMHDLQQFWHFLDLVQNSLLLSGICLDDFGQFFGVCRVFAMACRIKQVDSERIGKHLLCPQGFPGSSRAQQEEMIGRSI